MDAISNATAAIKVRAVVLLINRPPSDTLTPVVGLDAAGSEMFLADAHERD
jgi:hypothetical protein